MGQPVPEKVKAGDPVHRSTHKPTRLDVLREIREPDLATTSQPRRYAFPVRRDEWLPARDRSHLRPRRAAGPSDYASIEQDFGVGIELDGVAGMRWAIYQVEYRIATGAIVPVWLLWSIAQARRRAEPRGLSLASPTGHSR